MHAIKGRWLYDIHTITVPLSCDDLCYLHDLHFQRLQIQLVTAQMKMQTSFLERNITMPIDIEN